MDFSTVASATAAAPTAAGGANVAQAYIPFMLSVKGQLKTIELSLFRYDGAQNMFLSKPECAPPVEQKWRVTPLRWSAEREPFCVLTHRETSRMRLVVAKPDSSCELWPVMFSSDKPDGGIVGCSISPSRCKLVSFMWNNGLYLVGIDRASGGGAVFQVNAPQEPWVCIRDMPAETSNREWGNPRVRITPFYHKAATGAVETYFLVQDDVGGNNICKIIDPSEPWEILNHPSGVIDGPSPTSKVQFIYVRQPSQVAAGENGDWPIEVFASWIEGCTLYVAHVSSPMESWNVISAVPIPPNSRIGTIYVPFLSEPLLVSSSMDPNYLGSVAVRRLHLCEWILSQHGHFGKGDVLPPRVIRYMQVPALPVACRDLTADFPLTDLPYREYQSEFVGKRLPYDLTPPGIPLIPVIPAPPRAPSHSPVGLLLTGGTGGATLAGLVDKSRLDWAPCPVSMDEASRKWKITPLRWAPGREVLFVIMQSPELRSTRIAIAAPDKPCGQWVTQIEFPDATIPFSECSMTPFQYQTVPGSSDLFVFVVHHGSGKGGLFYVANPRSEWQFVREINPVEEGDLLKVDNKVSVMYHRSKDPASVNLCTFFVITGGGEQKNGVSVRVLIEPNQPTFDVSSRRQNSACVPSHGARDIRFLYTFSPKPPATHVWPCEVFVAFVRPGEEDELVVAHVPAPDAPWRLLYTQSVPAGIRISPVYLPYLAEPLLAGVVGDSTVDLIRLNLVQAYSTGSSDSGIKSKFIQRYHLAEAPVLEMEIADTTLDTALVWIPQMGLTGMHPYSGYPLPFEKNL